jgi:putative glycosyltransferase (TIGR04372 family)
LRFKILFFSQKEIQFFTKDDFHLRLKKDSQISYEWAKAVLMTSNGDYKKGVSIMRNILFDIQNRHKNFSSNERYPMYLSHHWATRFGHLGQICMKLKFDEMFRDYEFSQKIYIKDKSLFTKFEKLYNERLSPIYNINLLDFEHPSNWSEFDLIHMVKLKDDYIEHNAMHELVYSSCKVDRSNPLVRDTFTRKNFLKHVGLGEDDWYVAIHIRNTNYRFDERKVDQSKFNPALEAIIKAGGRIIQFGLNMTKVQLSDPDKVTYMYENEHTLNLDVSVIAHSRFLITTASGPIGVAHALGVPVLQTDSAAICLHSKTASIGTLYLPKKLIRNRQPITFSELAETGLGYTHISLSEWQKRGIEVVENTSSEVLNATIEMLNPEIRNSDLRKKLDLMRADYEVLAKGTFANSYLEDNSWMLI